MEATETKVCFKCERELLIDEFYVHSEMKDGHLGKCKDCACADVQQHRRRHAESVREYDKQRSCSPSRKARAYEYQTQLRERHPERSRANCMAYRALKKGQIDRGPCHFCGAEESLEMHHSDYSKPLRIYWLCRICHRKLDSMEKG